MSAEIKELLSEKIQEAVKDVFTRNLSMPIELVEKNTISEDSRTLLSSIQFDGTLKGTMAILSREFCASAIAMKMLGDDVSEDMLNTSDTIGEVLNMVLGGLKNKLEKTPYTFNLGTPKVLEKKTILDEKDTIVIEENFVSDDIKFKIEMLCHVVEAKPAAPQAPAEAPKPAAGLSAVDLLMQALAKNTNAQSASAPPAPAPTIPAETNSKVEKRVLIIHENTFEQELMKTGLKQNSSFNIDIAKNRLEAIDKMKSFKPDTIILDLYLSQSDGIRAWQEISQIKGSAKMVVLTSPSSVLAQKILNDKNDAELYDCLKGYNHLADKIQK